MERSAVHDPGFFPNSSKINTRNTTGVNNEDFNSHVEENIAQLNADFYPQIL